MYIINNKKSQTLDLILLVLTSICDKGSQIQSSFLIFLILFLNTASYLYIKSHILNLKSHILNSKSYVSNSKSCILDFINPKSKVFYLRY